MTPLHRPAAAPLALAAAVPLGVAASFLPHRYGDLRWLGLGVVVLAFVIAYRAMARRMPGPVALSGLIARGVGRPLGLGAAVLTLLCGGVLQLALYHLVGVAGAALLGGGAAWWVVALAGCAVVAGCGLLSSRVTAWLLPLLIPVGIAPIAGYRAPILADQAAAFSADGGASAAFSADRGASAASSAGLGGSGAGSWVGGLAGAVPVPEVVVGAFVLAGLVAAVVGVHQLIAHQLVVLGRERVLPAAVGRSPVAVSLAQSAVAGAAIGGCAYAGVAPGSELGVAGGLGIVLVLTVTSLAVLLFLNRDPAGEGLFKRLLAPLLSTVGLGVLCYLGLSGVMGIVAGAAVLAGAGYGLVLRRADPVRYAGIGLAGTAVVVTPAPPALPRQRLPGAHRPDRVDH